MNQYTEAASGHDGEPITSTPGVFLAESQHTSVITARRTVLESELARLPVVKTVYRALAHWQEEFTPRVYPQASYAKIKPVRRSGS